MPQKKNPDIAELIRAKAGRVLGNLAGVMSIYKAMPFTYNRDFQEMNPIMFESLEVADIATILMARMLEKVEFRRDVMLEKALKGFANATEVADLITKKGVPFRDAHKIVGRLVAEGLEFSAENIRNVAEDFGYSIQLSDDELKFDARNIVENRRNLGGTSKSEVKRMIEDRKKKLEEDRDHLANVIDRISRRLERLYEEATAILRSQ